MSKNAKNRRRMTELAKANVLSSYHVSDSSKLTIPPVVHIHMHVDKPTKNNSYWRYFNIPLLLLGGIASACTIANTVINHWHSITSQSNVKPEKSSNELTTDNPNISLPPISIRTPKSVEKSSVKKVLPSNVKPIDEINFSSTNNMASTMTSVPKYSNLYNAFSAQQNSKISDTVSSPEQTSRAVESPSTLNSSQTVMNRKEPVLGYSKIHVNETSDVLVHKVLIEDCYSAYDEEKPCPTSKVEK